MTTENMTIKNFHVFYGSYYYPRGGYRDFQGAFVSLQEAKQFRDKNVHDWCQIVDVSIAEQGG